MEEDKVSLEEIANERPLNEHVKQRAIKLQELGPRLQLKLLKVEAGICEGEVLYQRF